jgi:tRNA (adenine57-N1/adenine58-N1)-methyltransferase
MTCGIYECFAGVSRIVIEETKTPRGRFQEGDLALLIDRKGRRYLLTLSTESTFHTHVGTLPHKEIIGQEQGGWVHTSRGQSLLAIKPTLGDYVLAMPRGSQVIYPKDLGNILMLADIFPGATVVEAGLGSGALTSALLRAVGETGRVITYEVRDDMVARAMRNISVLAPNPCSHTLKMGDIYEGFHEQDVDRIVLDVPEPWHVVPQAAEALTMGGIFLSFLPTILQVHRLAQALTSDSRFQLIETVEVLLRPWSVTQRSVRPAHRMVAHTGFITTARRCVPKAGATLETIDEGAPEGPEQESQDG